MYKNRIWWNSKLYPLKSIFTISCGEKWNDNKKPDRIWLKEAHLIKKNLKIFNKNLR